MKKFTPLVGMGLAAALLVPAAAPATAADGDKRASAQAVFSELPTTNYRLSAKFNQRGRYWSSGRHTGLDFAAPRGTRGAYGKAVIVKHNSGKRSLYAHLAKIKTKKGKQVRGGQRIGKVGSTGNTTGPHLHFEIRTKNGKKLDPRPHLRGE
jgi:murein DD-endopeptidase MepM/ murein hydrolase activator NlpD